ncbi:MAG: tetraacyldisaccharide 4'-kinase, partial [Rhizobiales bacterium]|nr:tetraacyldisaccharide 4'-kinase [Hyphomicrobiales bacterium]
VFPAGPLREPLLPQLARASALVIIGDGPRGEAVAEAAATADVEVLTARMRARADAPDLSGRAVVAFCGIARPEKFYASLEAAGATIKARCAFGDHHPYSARDVARILDLAAGNDGALPITTEKDLVRLNETNDPGAGLRGKLQTLPIQVVFNEPERLDALLGAAMRAKL